MQLLEGASFDVFGGARVLFGASSEDEEEEEEEPVQAFQFDALALLHEADASIKFAQPMQFGQL